MGQIKPSFLYEYYEIIVLICIPTWLYTSGELSIGQTHEDDEAESDVETPLEVDEAEDEVEAANEPTAEPLEDEKLILQGRSWN